MREVKGWICPRCQNVYAPWVSECEQCNKTKLAEQPTIDQPKPETVTVDPNTQCIDCEHGEIIQSEYPGSMPFVRCRLYSVVRTISDTCIGDVIDVTQMTCGGDK